MKTIVVCLTLALVACNRGQIKSYVNDYFRLFDVGSGGRQLRSAAAVGGNGVTGGFYLPVSSGGNQAGRGGVGSSNFQGWNRGGGVNASALSQPGPIGDASGFSFSVVSAGAGSYGPPASSGGSGGSSNQGGSGGNGGSNFQGWSAGDLSNQDGSRAAGGSSAPNYAGSGGDVSGRVVGIVLEGIDQSIQLAQYHQTSLEHDLSFGGSPKLTSAIPSLSYGSPR